MQTLGYQPVWLERGIVSPEMVLRQYKTNGAKYCQYKALVCRKSALLAWSIFHVRPTRRELADVLAVLRVEPDRALVKKFLVGLASWASPARMRQLRAAARSMGFTEADEFDLEFARKYASQTLTLADFRQAVAAGDSATQHCVIYVCKSRSVLEAFAARGCDASVRKAATKKLRELDRKTGKA